MKILTTTFFIFLLVQLNAQKSPVVNLDGLCTCISTAMEEDNDHPNFYKYQTKILSEAHVISTDNKEEIKKKVQDFWKKNENLLFCDSLDFNVPNGSIVKLAVARRFEDFIDDVTETWNVDLNKIDASDNKTVLDYVKSEIELRKGSLHEPVLKRYYKKLRDAGAKHKSEL